MDIHETHLLATFKTVSDFGAKYAADFPAASVGGQQFAIVTAAVPTGSNFGAKQVSGKADIKTSVNAKAVAYKQIHDDMAAIADAAHSLVLLGTPGIDGKFLMPHNNGGQALLNAARSFQTNATPLVAQFVSVGLDANFLTTLGNHITDFETAISAKSASKGAQAGATSELEDNAHKAAIALHVLDTIVTNKYKNDPAKLAEWTIASHVEKHTPKPRVKPQAATQPQPRA